jgi:hypothetical protein
MATKTGTQKIHPVEEEDKMSGNRLFYVVIVLALTILAALTIRTAIATSSIVSVGYGDYDEVERGRTNFSKVPAETSYDEVEHLRANFADAASHAMPFPGKEKDDLAVLQSAPGVNGSLIEDRADRAQRIAVTFERYFRGKEKDDMVMP